MLAGSPVAGRMSVRQSMTDEQLPSTTCNYVSCPLQETKPDTSYWNQETGEHFFLNELDAQTKVVMHSRAHITYHHLLPCGKWIIPAHLPVSKIQPRASDFTGNQNFVSLQEIPQREPADVLYAQRVVGRSFPTNQGPRKNTHHFSLSIYPSIMLSIDRSLDSSSVHPSV